MNIKAMIVLFFWKMWVFMVKKYVETIINFQIINYDEYFLSYFTTIFLLNVPLILTM